MDSNAARRVLRLDLATPLTAETVEAAYSHEAWERHPSRYPAGEARDAAEAWAGTLAEARAVLLDSMLRAQAATGQPAPVAGQPGPWAPAGATPAPTPAQAAAVVPSPPVQAAARQGDHVAAEHADDATAGALGQVQQSCPPHPRRPGRGRRHRPQPAPRRRRRGGAPAS